MMISNKDLEISLMAEETVNYISMEHTHIKEPLQQTSEITMAHHPHFI